MFPFDYVIMNFVAFSNNFISIEITPYTYPNKNHVDIGPIMEFCGGEAFLISKGNYDK